MSNFPTLFHLALDVVVDFFEIGIPPTNHVRISPNVQEKIFATVMRVRDYCYDDHTKALIKMFQPKKLRLRLNGNKEESFDEIQKLTLSELKIDKFERISKYREPKTEHFRIGRFFDEILSQKTKQKLRVLDSWAYGSCSQNWMEDLSSMFPNLEVLNIHGRDMSVTDFTCLCSNFPNLRFLDISNSGIKNLNGLAKLENLECLYIYDLVFETKEDIKDLFELKKLKKFVFGDISDTWNYDWFFEKPLPALETLECHWEEANNAFLGRILPKLPKLKTVVAYDTSIMQPADFPTVTVCTGLTVEGMMKSIGFFRSQGNWEEVEDLFWHFTDHHTDWTEDSTPELITLMVNELEAVIRDFKLGRRRLPISVGLFLTELPEFINRESHLNDEKLKVIDILLLNIRYHLKKRPHPNQDIFKILCNGLNALIKTTENFNTDKVCSLTIKSIIDGGGLRDWEPICVVVLDTLMDQMDLASEYYRNINFRKLHESLRTIQKRTDLMHERRASVGNVLRFVELFM